MISADWSSTSPAQLAASHLSRPRNTSRSYGADLATFREFIGASSREEAVRRFLELGKGAAER